jgi:hypothetical protein
MWLPSDQPSLDQGDNVMAQSFVPLQHVREIVCQASANMNGNQFKDGTATP